MSEKRVLKSTLIIKNKKVKGFKFYYRKQAAEILQFENLDNFLSEQDMINLFMGFVKLIKKSITAEVEVEYKKKLLYYQTKIKNIMKTLN